MSGALGIEFSGSLSTSGGKLFEDLRLCLPAGQWTCLLGASGVGKTTILRLLAGLETHGKFEGQILAGEAPHKPDQIAYMAQSDLLLPWLNVEQNVAMGAYLRGEKPDQKRVKTLLEKVGLAAHGDKFPSQLSGGMRQRAALARTLMEDKPLVLLDEPFSALDTKTRVDCQNLATDMLRGKTVLLVTHDPGEAARLGHCIYIMHRDGVHKYEAKTATPRAVFADDKLQLEAQLFERLSLTSNEVV